MYDEEVIVTYNYRKVKELRLVNAGSINEETDGAVPELAGIKDEVVAVIGYFCA